MWAGARKVLAQIIVCASSDWLPRTNEFLIRKEPSIGRSGVKMASFISHLVPGCLNFAVEITVNNREDRNDGDQDSGAVLDGDS